MVSTSTSFVNLNFHAKNFREKRDFRSVQKIARGSERVNFGNWFVGVETTERG